MISVLAAVCEAAGSLVGAVEGAAAELDALDPQTRLSGKLEQQLLAMSARQTDRRLQSRKREQKRKIHGSSKPGRERC